MAPERGEFRLRARARASASAASVAAPTPAPIPVVSPTALDATGSDPEAAVARGPAVEIAAETAPDASAAIASSSFDASAAVFSPPTIAIAAVSATIRRNAVSSARSSASSAAAARLAAAYPAAPDAALAVAVAATPTTLFAHACNPCATIAAAWDTVAPCVRNTTGVIDATMGDATPAPAPKRCAAAMTAAAKTATTAARGANALAANPVVVVVVVVANAPLRAARGLEPLHAPARVSRSPFGSDSVSSGVVRADSSSPTRGIWMSAHSGMETSSWSGRGVRGSGAGPPGPRGQLAEALREMMATRRGGWSARMARRGGSGEPRGRARAMGTAAKARRRRTVGKTPARGVGARAERRGIRVARRARTVDVGADAARRTCAREVAMRPVRWRCAAADASADFKNEADGRGRVMGGGSRRQLSEGCMFVSARGTLMIDFMVHYSRFGPDEKKNCTDRFSGHLPDSIRSMVRTASGRLDCIRVRSGEPGMFWVFFSVSA